MTSIYGSLHYDRHIPDLIIVGITYSGVDPDYESLRASDFTPTATAQISNSGGAATFVKVLEQEIMPAVEKNYRTNKKDHAIAGTSFAGLFPTYVLFNAPHLFNGYIINNPSLWYDNEKTFEYESDFAKNHDTLDVNLYMVSGGLDDVTRFNKMVTQIRSRNYKKLNFDSHIAEGMGHSGSKFEAYAKGMQFLYKRRGIKLSDDMLKDYVGDYEVAPGQNFHLNAKDGHLVIEPFMGQPETPVYALGDDQFSTRGHDITSRFVRDTNGKVTAVKVEMSEDNIIEYKKL